MNEAVEAVIRAWNDEGTHPEYHREQKAKLAVAWPTLYAALQRLAEEELSK